jgi:hypothetical protein
VPFFGLHQDEIVSGLLSVQRWVWVGGEVVATKRYDRSRQVDGATLSEQTVFTLRHTPAA